MKYLIIALLILSSCQTQKKWQKKGYENGWLKDSVVTKYDTLRGFTHDTLVQFDTLHHTDTLFTYQNGLKVTSIIKWKERQVKQTITQRDTIMEYQFRTKVLKEVGKWWDSWFIGFICGACVFTIICGMVFNVIRK